MRSIILMTILLFICCDDGSCWRRRRRRRRAPAPVHGGWSGWALTGTCSKTCAGGIQYKRRTCNRPAPAHGGRNCAGPSTMSVSCKIDRCPEPSPIIGPGGIKYKRTGCYPRGKIPTREFILTERDPSSKVWNGYWIIWSNWDSYMPAFINRCAIKAKGKGYKIFMTTNYGNCWGMIADVTASKAESMCVKEKYHNCKDIDSRCVGKHDGGAVYKFLN